MKKLIAALALIALCQTAHAQVPGLVGPNQVLAGPTSGGTSQPAVSRALITQDLPNPLTLQQIINLNAAALPAATTGTLLEGGNADTVNSLYELSAFGAVNEFNGRRANGTNASPTTLVTTNIINALTGSGYDGTGWSAPAAAVNLLAEGTWSNTSHPSEACLQTTPTSSVTIATGLCQHQDKGVTLGSPTGGDEGANTINAAGAIYVNGVQVAAFPVATRAGDIIYWNGSAWTNFGGNTSGTQCYGENAIGAPQWTACSGGGGSSPGGSNSQIQYNASSSFGGASGLTTDGTHLTITVSGGTPANLTLDTPSTSEVADINFRSNGTTKWQIGKDSTSDRFYLYDFGASQFDMTVIPGANMTLMPSAGGVGIGNTFFADNSGHPYCDVRGLGGGTGSPSADLTAFQNAATNCAGGEIFVPCGTYSLSAQITLTAGTHIRGASLACSIIEFTSTTAFMFNCTSSCTGGHFENLTLYGPGLSFTANSHPTGGGAINTATGGGHNTYENLEIDGFYVPIVDTSTNNIVTGVRTQYNYGPYMLEMVGGGDYIHDNQIDNLPASVWSCIAANSGFTPWATGVGYNAGPPCNVVSSNGFYWVATSSGTSGSTAPSPTVYLSNVSDGVVNWQIIGRTGAAGVTCGLQCWVVDNDITSPYFYSVEWDGANDGQQGLTSGNQIGGALGAAVHFTGNASYNEVAHNTIQSILGSTATTGGYAIWDASSGSSIGVNVHDNHIFNITAYAMVVESAGWNIHDNTIFNWAQDGGGEFGIFVLSPLTSFTIHDQTFLSCSGGGAIEVTSGASNYYNIVNNIVNGCTISNAGTGGHQITTGNN